MKKRSKARGRRILLPCLFILGLVTVVALLPYQFGSAASERTNRLSSRTESAETSLPNYDIRDDANNKGTDAVDNLIKWRQAAGKDAAMVADIRDSFVHGEELLRARVPTLKVEYNQDIRIPEVIGTDVWQGRNFLSEPTSPAGTP